jgi:hypothetical protein
MMKRIAIFKTLHIAIVLMFFLPFMTFDWGCDPSAEQLAEQARIDSTRISDSIAKIYCDSIYSDSVAKSPTIENTESKNTVKTSNDSIAIKDSVEEAHEDFNVANQDLMSKIDTLLYSNNSKNKESKFLDYIGNVLEYFSFDGDGNLTGFGIVIFYFEDYLKNHGSTNAFILIIISSMMGFRKKWRFLKSILIIDIFGLIFLFFSVANLWGYWICLYSWIVLILYDFIFIRYHKKQSITMN